MRNSLGLAEDEEGEGKDEGEGEGGGANSSLVRLWGKTLKKGGRSYSRAELASLWSLLQQEEYTFLRFPSRLCCPSPKPPLPTHSSLQYTNRPQ